MNAEKGCNVDNNDSGAGERLLDYGHSRLVAVFDSPADVQAAVGDLTSAGFTASIDVHCGVEGARLIDFSGDEHGPLERMNHALHHLTVEGDHMDHYESELRAGHCIIMVRTPDVERRKDAVNILTAHAGHFINQFAVWTVETVQP